MNNKINYNTLLAVISDDLPTGNDLRIAHITLYQEIKNARNHARSTERKNLTKGTFSNLADWQVVHNLAIDILTHYAKDLEIVAWLIEATLRLHGFLGLSAGFCLANDLIQKFADSLFPSMEDEGLADTLSPLAYLNGIESDGTLIIPIALIPLTSGVESGQVALWQYQQVTENHLPAQQLNDPLDSHGQISFAEIIQSATETPRLFFSTLQNDLQSCLNAFRNLCATIDRTSEAINFPCSRLKNQIQACLNCVISLSEYGKSGGEPALDFPEKTLHLNSQNSYLDNISYTDPALSRTAALALIMQASQYFRRAEPHSPLSYLLEKALRWANLDLPALLSELVHDDLIRNNIYQLTGIVER